ncbi:MAG: type IV-A pilus assembly ATPase PilB [Candidatus Sumerlaeota bacterium]|nr:type IV-A pilus assembly ATPase PilB [Candidatus Sumerlaeota bacterium]
MVTTMERRLGEMLVKENIIRQDDLEKALKKQEEDNTSLGRVIVDMGLASEWEMAAAIGKQLNVPFITLSHYEIDHLVLESIPEEIVRKYKIVPVDKTGDTLTVALSDPSNIYLQDELRLLTKCKIIPVISFESDIMEAINQYYSGSKNQGSKFDEMLKDITDQEQESLPDEENVEFQGEQTQDDDDLSVDVDDAPVIQLVNLVISEAIKAGASDIHVEPYEKTLRLRYRIDGVLQEMTPPPKKFQNAIISRIKILSEMDIAEKRLPQDGRFKARISNRNIDFRVSTCPIAHGEKVVIRILDQNKLKLSLEDLGFETEIRDKFVEYIHKPWGMILITGPTGSGKSTTLYTALSTINDSKKNISTIEDPIEYQIRGINQVQAKPDIGLTFAAGLRSFLRQDPDIIMVGEIRDLETAEIAVRAALTGHLVLSTIHTNDATSTLSRLTDMGVEPFLVTASLLMVIAQRLVRRICGNCKEEFIPTPESLNLAQVPQQEVMKLWRGPGCSNCRGTGYKGRVALYELLVMTERLKELIISGGTASQIKKTAISEGMETLRTAGIKKAFQGLTTIEEVVGITIADDVQEKTGG